MNELIERFFRAYWHPDSWTVYTDTVPAEMMDSEVNESGWFVWKLLPGSLTPDDYRAVEQEFGITYPRSFIEWHRAYYFFDGDCSLLRLPSSNPNEPLQQLRYNLEAYAPEGTIPFADEGNDAGPLVFDARTTVADNEFPIRVFDYEYGDDPAGLSDVIFSSFTKLLECITHYLEQSTAKEEHEVIADFFRIDPLGAGATGRSYWQG